MQPHPLAADRGPQGPLLRSSHVPQHVNSYQNETLLVRNLTRPPNRHQSLFVTDCCMSAAFRATTCCGQPRGFRRQSGYSEFRAASRRLRNKPLNWLGGGETPGYRADRLPCSRPAVPRAPAASAAVGRSARLPVLAAAAAPVRAGEPRSAGPGRRRSPALSGSARGLWRGAAARPAPAAPRAGRSGRGGRARLRPGAARRTHRCAVVILNVKDPSVIAPPRNWMDSSRVHVE